MRLKLLLDLAEGGSISRLMEILQEAGIEVEMLVNNAGISSRSMAVDSDPATLRRLVDLNVGALTELTAVVIAVVLAVVIARLVGQGHGSVLNFPSIGAYVSGPTLTAYAAFKAYVLSFTEALWVETKASGVRVVAVSPGPTHTPMNSRASPGK